MYPRLLKTPIVHGPTYINGIPAGPTAGDGNTDGNTPEEYVAVPMYDCGGVLTE